MTANTHQYDEAIQLTAVSLQRFIDTTEQLTHLSLPERTALIEEISRVVPAGNVPSLITAGLATLPGRVVPGKESRRHLALLIQGMQTFMDRAVFQAFFAGPATVLSAYQMILKLAGKDPDQAFPEGTWQFYVEFGLREDSSHHACETVGFYETLREYKLEQADELAAWVLASAWLLRNYNALLANEWLERTRLHQIGGALGQTGLVEQWLKLRPYRVPENVDHPDFIRYRQEIFEDFCQRVLARSSNKRQLEREWAKGAAQREQTLAAYQQQMGILAYLQPGDHNDTRIAIPPEQLRIAVIAGKRYYLINLNAIQMPLETRELCAAILRHKPIFSPATLDRTLRPVQRREQNALRRMLSKETQDELDLLRTAPIIINWDEAKPGLLADIRSGQRGVGDHALTITNITNKVMPLVEAWQRGTSGARWRPSVPSFTWMPCIST